MPVLPPASSTVFSARFAWLALPTLLAAVAAAIAAADAWLGRRRLAALTAECAKLRELRAAERAGRTAAERRLRHAQASRPEPSSPSGSPNAPAVNLCSYRPIGVLESCYAERRGTPRQGLLVPAARARLRLDPRVIQPAAALEGLEGFSHVWLIFDFHENTNAGKAAAATVANTSRGESSGGDKGGNGRHPLDDKTLARLAHPPPQVRRCPFTAFWHECSEAPGQPCTLVFPTSHQGHFMRWPCAGL
jgi:hypothetical protein